MGEIIQAVDLVTLIGYIDKRNKKLQAILLQNMEKNFDKGSKEYIELRKIILDETSDFARSVVRKIFGDGMEYLVK